jgi:hypothetical protein
MSQTITEINFNELFNTGIKSFGYENVVDIISSFYNTYNLPIVSMGSGTGVIEYLAKKKNNDINWICVDNDPTMNFPPDANQYINQPLMNIDYNSCDQLIEATPSIVNNCILFLNWCEPNESTYDYEAIIKLKPIAVLSIYEIFEGQNGAAGGEMFYNWTYDNTDYRLKEEYKLFADDYDNDNYEFMNVYISWWQSNSLNDFDDAVIRSFPCMYYRPKLQQCTIS